MKILGIDPGVARVGWGLVEESGGKQSSLAWGCFETQASKTLESRLEEIHNFLENLIAREKPDQMAVEQLFFATNAKTAIAVGQSRGVIILTAKEAQLPVVSYTPLQVKLALTGYGQADKHQIQMMVKTILKLPKVPTPDDAADALAIALTHAFSYKLRAGTK
jgi:crossover junction endodeoxyribonuclease RuvC